MAYLSYHSSNESKSSKFLHAGIYEPIILAYFKAKGLHILDKMKVTLRFNQRFVQQHFNWSF
jgi:hypothetical protein